MALEGPCNLTGRAKSRHRLRDRGPAFKNLFADPTPAKTDRDRRHKCNLLISLRFLTSGARPFCGPKALLNARFDIPDHKH